MQPASMTDAVKHNDAAALLLPAMAIEITPRIVRHFSAIHTLCYAKEGPWIVVRLVGGSSLGVSHNPTRQKDCRGGKTSFVGPPR